MQLRRVEHELDGGKGRYTIGCGVAPSPRKAKV
jgi:hypothetical protein